MRHRYDPTSILGCDDVNVYLRVNEVKIYIALDLQSLTTMSTVSTVGASPCNDLTISRNHGSGCERLTS